MFAAFVALALAAIASAAPTILEERGPTCYGGAYVIGVRGTGQPAGFGGTAPVVNGVLSRIPNSGSTALGYPATYINPLYPDSVITGITALKTLVTDYANSCKGKIVLVGFSQGANVISSMLAGGTDFPAPLAANIAARISAITLFGDPTFVHGQSYNVGTDTTMDGIFARKSSLAALNKYAPKLKSYCNMGDVYCASGQDKGVHTQEIPTWGNDAINFIVNLSK